MDEEIDRLVIAVRADTDAFRRDVEAIFDFSRYPCLTSRSRYLSSVRGGAADSSEL